MKASERDKILFWLEERNTSNKKGKINILKSPLKIYLDSFVVEGMCEDCVYFTFDFQHQMCSLNNSCSLEEVSSCEKWEKHLT
jgi:hypothetical protein